jgi:hypothetical protein
VRRFDFPEWLQRTPAELAAESQVQAERLASFGRAKMSEAERLISRGALLEETARGNLAAAARDKGAEARRVEREQLKALAHSLAMQGRYEEAIKFHPLKRMQKHYQGILDAIERPDDDRCECEDARAKVDGVEIAVTPRFERAQIFSAKHGGAVSLVECSQCGNLNARPLAGRLLRHKAAVNESMMAQRPLLSDAQVLARK